MIHRSFDALLAGLDVVRRAPADDGRLELSYSGPVVEQVEGQVLLSASLQRCITIH